MLTNRRRTRRTRRNMLWGLAAIVSFMAVILVIPGILVNRFEVWEPSSFLPLQPREELHVPEASPSPLVTVYLTKREETVDVPLEAYVRGVLAAEMPASFELEALKAQAIAARTYIVRRLEASATAPPTDLPEGAGAAVVTDTVQHQAYATDDALRERWGWFAYARNLDKLTRAVNETAGLILTYEGEPIDATFFSASNGRTENAEDYWRDAVPYLRSVASPWDAKYAPDYERQTTFSFGELYRLLELPATNRAPTIVVESTSAGGRVLTAKVAGRTFTGRDIRERLGLASSDFRWEINKDEVIFTTEGYGHGVGMSQWGANGMAKEGGTAEAILTHYYSGIELESIDGRALLAKK
ncbi:stage II sporulation protein D [Paenibacillus sp. TRM 82003]|nr:stage II sporulation protein D [Paenibacillus sp. TRM 82003]MCI3923444.1 stage II sporulation protein D [Paenibacillus sp. TRM 82003]